MLFRSDARRAELALNPIERGDWPSPSTPVTNAISGEESPDDPKLGHFARACGLDTARQPSFF